MQPFRFGFRRLWGGALLPFGQHPGHLLGRSRCHLSHQGSFVPGELFGAECLRLSQHLHPRLGHLTGSKGSLRLGHLLERPGHRHLATAGRSRVAGQSHQPFSRRRVALLAGQIPLLGHGDQAGDPSVPAAGFAQGGDQLAGHRLIRETVETRRAHRLDEGDRFRIHPTYVSRACDTNRPV
ncbi:MAG: hypothetical protein MUE66_10700 [Acidimicrobiia bacterium]|nr:hypothetical protein [Acidimicrobiia bacterium]